jgi:hypothetical protein
MSPTAVTTQHTDPTVVSLPTGADTVPPYAGVPRRSVRAPFVRTDGNGSR